MQAVESMPPLAKTHTSSLLALFIGPMDSGLDTGPCFIECPVLSWWCHPHEIVVSLMEVLGCADGLIVRQGRRPVPCGPSIMLQHCESFRRREMLEEGALWVEDRSHRCNYRCDCCGHAHPRRDNLANRKCAHCCGREGGDELSRRVYQILALSHDVVSFGTVSRVFLDSSALFEEEFMHAADYIPPKLEFHQDLIGGCPNHQYGSGGPAGPYAGKPRIPISGTPIAYLIRPAIAPNAP